MMLGLVLERRGIPYVIRQQIGGITEEEKKLLELMQEVRLLVLWMGLGEVVLELLLAVFLVHATVQSVQLLLNGSVNDERVI